MGRLRVVGGTLSGRRFAASIANVTRPTSDRVREAVASAVESRGGFEGTRVLDLFAGTGAMAIEALSRGAEHATLVERDRQAVRSIEASLEVLGVAARARVLALDLSSPRATSVIEGSFDRVLIDPPYAEVESVPPLLEALADAGRIEAGALIVLEHPSTTELALGARFEPLTRKRYGDTSVLIARYAPPPP